MDRKFLLSGALLVVLALCWCTANQKSTAQRINKPQLPRWEYHVLEMHGGHFDRSAANKMGTAHWELVGSYTPTNRDAVSIIVFKRPLR